MFPHRHKRLVAWLDPGSKLPWWAGVALAGLAYFGLENLSVPAGPDGAQPAMLAVGRYLLTAVFLAVALRSAYGRLRRRRSHIAASGRPGAGALDAMSRQQFETLLSEAYRRKGYAVSATGNGSPDGGVDLSLRKGDAHILVYCRQWRALQVGVNSVRELHGLMTARDANAGVVVTAGVFTAEARAFARDRQIELMAGKALQDLVRGVTVPGRIFRLRDPLSVLTNGAPFCPQCQSRMVKRKARSGSHAGKVVWSCSRYPDCRGTRPL